MRAKNYELEMLPHFPSSSDLVIISPEVKICGTAILCKLFLFPIRKYIFTYKVLCVDVSAVECEGGHRVQVAGDAGQM